MHLFKELQRRNVFRVAIGYIISSWLLLQVADLVLENIGAPAWLMQSLMLLVALGFPVFVFFSWAYEVTPEGIKKESEVDRSRSITHETGSKLNLAISAVLVATVAFLLIDKFYLQSAAESPEPESITLQVREQSVAVLPFVAMNTGEDNAYFADGLTEEIINSLTQVPELLVTARTSAFAFKDQDLPITEIARKLGVAHVVEGSVRRADDQLRITAQLIRADNGFHLWSETYDRPAAQTFVVQAEIAAKIAQALDVVLSEEQVARMRSSGLRNPEAFLAYQKGIAILDQAHEASVEPEVMRKANLQFDRTIELEPGFSPAYFNSADYYIHSIHDMVIDPNTPFDQFDEMRGEVVSRLEKAVQLGANDGQKLTAQLELALVSENWRRMPALLDEADDSTKCFRSSWWGMIQTYFRPLSQSQRLWEKLVACNPMYYINWVELAYAQIGQGNFLAAVETSERGLEHNFNKQIINRLTTAYLATGQIEKARSIAIRYYDAESDQQIFDLRVAAIKGSASEAQAIFDEILASEGEGSMRIWHYSIMGDRDGANRIAASFDARPMGFMSILNSIDNCFCGKPFDLKYTPNLARMIEEANLIWPPAQSIEWPLKNW